MIEWGQTTVGLVHRALRGARSVSESILGAVLNKADIKSVETYDPYARSYFFYNGEQP